SDLGAHPSGVESMSGTTVDDARALFAGRNLIAVGVRGDEERRRRHGARTTFVRVIEADVDTLGAGSGHANVPPMPAQASAGEIRLVGRPATFAAAVDAIKAARGVAGATPLTGFSLAD